MWRTALNPILKFAPLKYRVGGYGSGIIMAGLTAANPLTWFTKPYWGLVTWMIVAWWFYKANPRGLIRDGERFSVWSGLKALIFGAVLNIVPLTLVYAAIMALARADAKSLLLL